MEWVQRWRPLFCRHRRFHRGRHGKRSALLAWVVMDLWFGIDRKPTFFGAVNGMISGLVASTLAAGHLNGLGALFAGIINWIRVWLSWNKLSKARRGTDYYRLGCLD
jgi:ammonia channel protein AmtB